MGPGPALFFALFLASEKGLLPGDGALPRTGICKIRYLRKREQTVVDVFAKGEPGPELGLPFLYPSARLIGPHYF